MLFLQGLKDGHWFEWTLFLVAVGFILAMVITELRSKRGEKANGE